MSYSSKDFSKTSAEIIVDLPDKLIHKDVCASSQDESFSDERKHPVHIVDVDSQTISMTIGKLSVGQQTNKHRHSYETIIYVQQGTGKSIIEDKVVEWKAGDAVYIPVWAWHSHYNLGNDECVYIAAENTPLLQNLGLAFREEG